MLADFFTKALQGSLFLKFKRVIMGEEHVSTLKRPLSLAPSQERVACHNITTGNVEEVLSGANGQTADDVYKMYASVLKDGAWTKVLKKGARTKSSTAVKFEALSHGKSERAHSLE
jgi:hypothetical protein